MAMPSISPARRLALTLAVAASLAAGTATSATATSASYCGGGFTPAHGWCYYGVPFGWRYVQATYGGRGSFNICAALNNYTTRATLFKDCRTASGGYAGGCYFGGSSNADPGVGNTDNNQHTISGYADNVSC